MQLGLVGLGKMGFTMRQRLSEPGHEVIGYASRQDHSPTMKAVSAPRNQFGGHAVQRVPLSG